MINKSTRPLQRQYYINLPEGKDVDNFPKLLKHALQSIVEDADGRYVRLNQFYFVNPEWPNDYQKLFMDYEIVQDENIDPLWSRINADEVEGNIEYYFENTKYLNRASISLPTEFGENGLLLINATAHALQAIKNLHVYDMVFHNYSDMNSKPCPYIVVYFDTVE